MLFFVCVFVFVVVFNSAPTVCLGPWPPCYTTLRTALHYHRYAADYVGKARAHRAGGCGVGGRG